MLTGREDHVTHPRGPVPQLQQLPAIANLASSIPPQTPSQYFKAVPRSHIIFTINTFVHFSSELQDSRDLSSVLCPQHFRWCPTQSGSWKICCFELIRWTNRFQPLELSLQTSWNVNDWNVNEAGSPQPPWGLSQSLRFSGGSGICHSSDFKVGLFLAKHLWCCNYPVLWGNLG